MSTPSIALQKPSIKLTAPKKPMPINEVYGVVAGVAGAIGVAASGSISIASMVPPLALGAYYYSMHPDEVLDMYLRSPDSILGPLMPYVGVASSAALGAYFVGASPTYAAVAGSVAYFVLYKMSPLALPSLAAPLQSAGLAFRAVNY